MREPMSERPAAPAPEKPVAREQNPLWEIGENDSRIAALEEDATIMMDAILAKDTPPPKPRPKNKKEGEYTSPFEGVPPVRATDLLRVAPELEEVMRTLKSLKLRRAKLEALLDPAALKNLQEMRRIRVDLARAQSILPTAEAVLQGSEPASLESAAHIMGEQLAGPEEVFDALGVEVKNVPPIPYTAPELIAAKARGDVLVLRLDKDEEGSPMTIERMDALRITHFMRQYPRAVNAKIETGSRYKSYGMGYGIEEPVYEKLVATPEIIEKLIAKIEPHPDRFIRGVFPEGSVKKLVTEPVRGGWKLVSKIPIDQPVGAIDIVEQTRAVRDALLDRGLIPANDPDLALCTDEELDRLKQRIERNRAAGVQEVLELGINAHHRRSAAEVWYDHLVAEGKTGVRDSVQGGGDYVHGDFTLSMDEQGQLFRGGVNAPTMGGHGNDVESEGIASSFTEDGKKVVIGLRMGQHRSALNMFPWFLAAGTDAKANEQLAKDFRGPADNKIGGVYLCY